MIWKDNRQKLNDAEVNGIEFKSEIGLQLWKTG
jgi:hypothetical protein